MPSRPRPPRVPTPLLPGASLGLAPADCLPNSTTPTTRFWVLLSLLVVAGCAGYAALVLHTAPAATALALRATYPYSWAARSYTAAEFSALRQALAGLALGAAGGAGLLAAGAAGRRELGTLRQEVRRAAGGLRAGGRALQPAQRRLAGAGLLALTLLRGYYSFVVQPYDDATSYELFVREPLLTVSAVYALPNNHVLATTISWLFYQVHPGFWWTMRLPVLLTSTAATALWFLGLLRRATFRVAFGAVGWFSLLHLSLYYAATGRGYWLLTGLGAVVFFAVLDVDLALAEEGNAARPRAAGAALVLAGVLGLYTVPTHALLLVSAYTWLGGRALGRRAGGALLRLAGLAGLTGLGAALLYAPLLLLSGWGALGHNSYVQPLNWAAFWRTLAEAALERHHLLALPVVLAVLGGFGGLAYAARAGRPPGSVTGGITQLVRQLGGVSAWFFLLPYGLALLALVPPPERTLLYKAQYLCILAAVLVEAARARATTPAAQRRWRWGLVGGTWLLAASQLWQLERQESLWRQSWRWQLGAPLLNWLATQPPGAVLALEQRLPLRFYAHTQHGRRRWQIDETPRPGVHYRYVVTLPGAPVPGGLARTRPAFHTALADIFVVP